MELVGTLEPGGDLASDRHEWTRLIGVHPRLSPPPPRQGINPFTRKPHTYTPTPDTARVLLNSQEIGVIHRAMDDSRRLLVLSRAGSEEEVIGVAQEIASRLGWHFVSATAA
jgi:hypothetical protein